jgi:hypothetical protein
MEKGALKKILDFLEEEENKTPMDKGGIRWKLVFNEPLTYDELNISGNLDLSNTDIISLPEGLEVEGSLYLRNCKSLAFLPESLKVGKSLALYGCKNLTSIPESLERILNLEISHTSIESLPKGLVVLGDLVISGTMAKLSNEKIREMVKPGIIKGRILR